MKQPIYWLLLPFLIFLFGCTDEPKPITVRAGESSTLTGNPLIDGLSEKIKKAPEDPSLYAQRAGAYYEMENYDEAIADLNQALTYDQDNVELLHVLADVYLDYFKSLPALRTMERAAELYPKRIPTLLKLSEFQMILKRYEDAIFTLERIRAIDPQNADMFFMFGAVFTEMGRTEEAITAFKKATSNDPELVDGWIKLGQLLAAKEDPLAGKMFENALSIAPENIEALHALGNYQTDQEELEAAIQTFRQINIVDPTYEEGYFNAGLLYLDLDSLDRAYQHFDLAVKTSPVFIQGYYYRGLASELRGNKEAALRDYQQALAFAPNYERALEAVDRLKN